MAWAADRAVLRELAARVAEIAALPEQQETRRLWRVHNDLAGERPMVAFDQVCWSEFADPALALECEDPECRRFEQALRRTLYQWDHFRADQVVDGFVRVDKALTPPHRLGEELFGLRVSEDIQVTDAANDVVSHGYHNLFRTLEDVDQLVLPEVGEDAAETRRRVEQAEWLFDGLLPVREAGWGWDPYVSCWDPIAMWMSVEGILYGLIDTPELLHAVVDRLVLCWTALLDQLEAQGLLYQWPQSTVHCTGAWTDELAAPAQTTRDLWMYGLAQALTTVSPAMFGEYEIDPMMPLFDRFGLVYYGCCDPLDGRMEQVLRIPHLRKVSCSPWADPARMAAALGPGYVLSDKPNPALLAGSGFDAEAVRADLRATLAAARPHGTPVEFIFKDISTVARDPSRLEAEAKVAMEVARAGY
ncbi:MAG: hypothetical protein LBR33_02005 [Propionibacteriaceae bacterium]|nr:hypothetical protein [Propionibacteriaceae bacterium]